eukprot:gene7741-10518_t
MINTGGNDAFLTQKGEKINEVRNDISELENLLAVAAQTSQSTLLLKKRKEMREVDESLELMKKDYKRRMNDCEERRLQFELKQAKMREQILKFEKFIQENDAKRQRAEAKAKQERKLYEEKIKEVYELEKKMNKLLLEQRSLVQELETKSCYKTFLERIVEENEFGYEEVGEILNRHNILIEANRDLMDQAALQEQKADEFRKKLQSLHTEKQNQLLVSNSILQSNQKELEKMVIKVKKEEEEKLQLEDKKKDISRELSQISQAVKNIFGRCNITTRTGILPSVTTYNGGSSSTQQQGNNALSELLDYNLDVICLRMVDLIEISNEYKVSMDSNQGGFGNNSNALLGSNELKESSLVSNSKSQFSLGSK